MIKKICKKIVEDFTDFFTIKKSINIDYLTKLGVPYTAMIKNNILTIDLQTSIFPRFLHSFKRYNNIYIFTVMRKELIPSRIFIELDLTDNSIKGLYSNVVHLNSEPIYKYGHDLFNICVDEKSFKMTFLNYDHMFKRILNRINTWNYLDRTVNIKLNNQIATMIPATEFSIQQLNQLKRLDWIKKVLTERNQQYIMQLHF